MPASNRWHVDRRRQADHQVSWSEVGAGSDLCTLDDADTEPGEVVVVAVIQSWQFGGLASYQGAASNATARRDPRDHVVATSTLREPVAK